MSRRVLIAFFSMLFVYGLSIAVAPDFARAAGVNCDVNACISACSKRCATPGCACAPNCLQTIEARKKGGQCPK